MPELGEGVDEFHSTMLTEYPRHEQMQSAVK